MKEKIISWLVIVITVVILAGVLLMTLSGVSEYFDYRTNALLRVGSCVDKMAVEQGFAGTSKEAWDLFASECDK